MSDSLTKNSPQQATEPAFSRNSSEDWTFWRLSLILREIAGKLASDAEKATSPRQPPVGDSLTSGEEGDPNKQC